MHALAVQLIKEDQHTGYTACLVNSRQAVVCMVDWLSLVLWLGVRKGIWPQKYLLQISLKVVNLVTRKKKASDTTTEDTIGGSGCSSSSSSSRVVVIVSYMLCLR